MRRLCSKEHDEDNGEVDQLALQNPIMESRKMIHEDRKYLDLFRQDAQELLSVNFPIG